MKLRNRAHLSVADTEYGSVLLDARSGEYWQLNPSAAVVARTLLDGGGSAEAATRLTEAFDVDGARAAADVEALLAAMRAAGVVIQE
ncbi:lasso peptide biosynthesis PqqD family chaperone [Streptomyces antimicrobicus]|uniref:Lasso peptide biosynthesis PqqD family chaperone n=1 Tax=Streptomyces antimicrobicus TaxID=2883108 RepID=A0ABS8BCD8_9ACTN|nr:lasso peptide biosynthesis PqqD family chaperone [Streptomyces antimicrobicus]MCB5182191.1 lasso peptide biosynthesis PqqD family chaperone [Streptomyces antimicrobicus]